MQMVVCDARMLVCLRVIYRVLADTLLAILLLLLEITAVSLREWKVRIVQSDESGRYLVNCPR